MMKYAFEELDFERVEFKTDVQNARARKGLQNVGGIEEGILRSHMKMWNNRRRTSIYYSVLKDEWPGLKQTIFKDIKLHEIIKEIAGRIWAVWGMISFVINLPYHFYSFDGSLTCCLIQKALAFFITIAKIWMRFGCAGRLPFKSKRQRKFCKRKVLYCYLQS